MLNHFNVIEVDYGGVGPELDQQRHHQAFPDAAPRSSTASSWVSSILSTDQQACQDRTMHELSKIGRILYDLPRCTKASDKSNTTMM
jgi:hypothetical protein